MNTLLILLALTIVPQDGPIVVRCCDVVEENHVYDNDGKPILTQLIFWRGDIPVGWITTSTDIVYATTSRPGRLRLVRKSEPGSFIVNYKSYFRSDTQYDVEREARKNCGDNIGKIQAEFWESKTR